MISTADYFSGDWELSHKLRYNLSLQDIIDVNRACERSGAGRKSGGAEGARSRRGRT